ncbi:type II secretion system F family protein [uncultured Litoreibacter sp.]|uniref:type II secretion system F family protein n=1 Tax=uncultured Litoreibacter sp. TaxID=1392394 RepID=UPI00260C76E9|nr:type II secretion system F family protein [uncultured Litoreibacter sp.]
MGDWVFPAGPEYIPYVVAMVGALVCFEGIRQSFFDRLTPQAIKSKRLHLMKLGLTRKELLSLATDRDESGLLRRIPFFGSIPNKMRQAGMTMKPSAFLSACGFAVAAIMIIGSVAIGPLGAAAIAMISGIVIPATVVNIARKKRVARFGLQLPDALDQMTRGLRVGHPLNTTLVNVAATMPDPIGSEFGYVADQIAYGDNLVDAFGALARRIDQEDMYYLAVSVGIQHGSGGNLGKMLGTLAKTVRQRAAMRRKVKAISAEGRISALVLSLLPFLIFGGTSLTAPEYYPSVQDDPLFMPMAVAVVLLVAINFFALRKVANFRI